MEQRYVLEKSAEFHERNASPGLSETEQLEEGLSILKFRAKMVTISSVMKEILEELRNPHTVDEVVTWVSEQKHCTYNTVYSSVYSFLDQMVRLGALVREQEQLTDKRAIFDDWQTNNKFKGYTLVDQIGKKSDVFLFKCIEESRPEVFFTLKILVGKKKSAFLREAEILNSLPPHTNIRRCCFASSRDDEFPHLLLEFVEGKPISSSDIKDEKPIFLKYKIALEMLLAMEHLHNHGILHGDIHASNFLVNENNEVKLIDLGMSHRLGDEHVSHGGIAKYMPPERMPDSRLSFSDKKGNYQSEIFQLGICIYFLFSGHLPFGGLLLKDLAHEIKHTDPEPLMVTPLGESISKPVAEVIFRSLEKVPAFRFQSVEEMISAWLNATGIKKEQHEFLQSIN